MSNSGKITFGYLKGAVVIGGFIAFGGFIFAAILAIASGVFQPESSQPSESSGASHLPEQLDATEAGFKNNNPQSVDAAEYFSTGKIIADQPVQIQTPSVTKSPAPRQSKITAEKVDHDTNPPLSAKTTSPAKTATMRPARVFETTDASSTNQVYSRADEYSEQRHQTAERQKMNDRRAFKSNRVTNQELRGRRPMRVGRRGW